MMFEQCLKQDTFEDIPMPKGAALRLDPVLLAPLVL